MITLTPTVSQVKPADRFHVFPLALPSELDFIESDARDMAEAFIEADDFDPPADSPLWDEWSADSAAMDAACDGCFPF